MTQNNQQAQTTTSVLSDEELPVRVTPNQKETAWLAYLVGAIALFSLLARAWRISRVGLTHYDEGVYLLSSFWSLRHTEGPGLFPWQKLFSPPAYFGLIGAMNWLFSKASDLHAIAINVAFGWLTVLAAYWAGKRWFGARAGLAAAALIGLSEFHVAYSRSALTDTGFTFFFLVSMALIAICLEKNQPLWGIAAGLAIGATWNMKYHGWLLLALAFAAAAPKALGARSQPETIKKIAFCWLVMTGVALTAFLPWFLYAQFRLGGYAEINEFHGRFLNFRWAHNFRLQAEMQPYFDGWLSRISPSLAFLSAALCSPRCSLNYLALIAAALLLLLASTVLGVTATCFILALAAVLPVWRAASDFGRLLVITFGAFFFLLPCYQAFARLLLPFSVVVILLAGYAFKLFLENESVRRTADQLVAPRTWKGPALATGAAVLAILAMYAIKRPETHTFAAETGYRDAVQQMASTIPPNAVVFVIAEPEVAFYFQAAGWQTFCICIDPQTYQRYQATHPVHSDRNVPQYIVAGFYAKQWWKWNPPTGNASSPYQLLARVPAPPGDIRLLDDFPTEQSRKALGSLVPMYDLYLYKHLSEGSVASSNTVR